MYMKDVLNNRFEGHVNLKSKLKPRQNRTVIQSNMRPSVYKLGKGKDSDVGNESSIDVHMQNSLTLQASTHCASIKYVLCKHLAAQGAGKCCKMMANLTVQ